MTSGVSRWAPLPLRLMLGIGFAYHGFPKIFTGGGHQMFVGMLQNLGVPAPALMAWVVGIVESFGGLALIAGIFVRPVAVLLIVNMLVAIFKVHLASGFNFVHITGMTESGPTFGMPGYEAPLLYLAGLLSLLVSGPGALGRGGREKRAG